LPSTWMSTHSISKSIPEKDESQVDVFPEWNELELGEVATSKSENRVNARRGKHPWGLTSIADVRWQKEVLIRSY
jgi:hypothetical protein